MDHETYTQIPAVNWSSLKLMEPSGGGSPHLYRWRQTHPAEDKPSYQLGRAIHCAILEPEKFDGLYTVYEGRRAGKDWEAFQSAHEQSEILKAADMDILVEVRAAVRENAQAMELLAQGAKEQPVKWVDAATGLACKARLDELAPSFILDLKTTSTSLLRWTRDAEKYLYHGQFAFYLDGAIADNRLPPDARACALVVQTVEPFDVGIYWLPPETLDAGRRLVRRNMATLQMCLSTDFWPGQLPDPAEWHLSRWAAGNEETEDSEEIPE